MTEQEMQTKLETLDRWELAAYWKALSQKDIYVAEKVFKTDKALNKKVLKALMRACQYHVGDTVIFALAGTEGDQTIPEGTIGKITQMTRYLDNKVSVVLLVDNKEISITRYAGDGYERPSGLDLRSIAGYWHWRVLYQNN